MHERALSRAAAIAAALLLLAASIAAADTLPGDTDDLSPGVQGTLALGPVAVGDRIAVPLWFELTCRGIGHVDQGQVVHVAFRGGIVPTGGDVTSTGTTVGPVPAEWPVDFAGCPSGLVVRSAEPALVTLTAPPVPGLFDYVVDYSRTLVPAGASDSVAIASATGATFRLTVVANTPPTLALPDDAVIEGDAPGGATVAYAVGASDAEDDPDPVPTCSPASGAFYPLGESVVACTVTDSAGASTSGSFSITVVDSTPPTLVGVPAAVAMTTADPSGTTAAYATPAANDAVDAAPDVVCDPAPGDPVPVGTTTVTCTATDDSGNAASASFALEVTYVPPVVLAAVFDEPVGAGGALSGASGRTLPVKARIQRDGVPVVDGTVDLVLERCGGGPTVGLPVPLGWHGDRWTVGLDTSGLVGCLHAMVRLDGVEAGGFELRLGASGSEPGVKAGRR